MIFMINQLDNRMLETLVQLNFPFIRDDLKEVQDMGVGLFKNYSLMGNFMIPQPLSIIEVSYQYFQMVSADLDQNLPLMEEYDPVTWPILVVISPRSLYFLDKILSLDETILEVINI